MRELVEDYAEHPDYLDKVNWYFLPSANPDGYAYSWEHDRLWRKTRSEHGSILGCKGVDPNRNWGFHYGESGVSHNECSETYCGPEAFSEPEMKNIRDFVMGLDPVPSLGHTFHSYSQLWLWPYVIILSRRHRPSLSLPGIRLQRIPRQLPGDQAARHRRL